LDLGWSLISTVASLNYAAKFYLILNALQLTCTTVPVAGDSEDRGCPHQHHTADLTQQRAPLDLGWSLISTVASLNYAAKFYLILNALLLACTTVPVAGDNADRGCPHQHCTAEQTLSVGPGVVGPERQPASAALGTHASLAIHMDADV